MEDRDRRMLGGVLDLSEMDVTQVMVHRKNIVLLDADLPARELVREALEAPYTRLPLYRGDSENIIGVLHARDLARAIAFVAETPRGGFVTSIELQPEAPLSSAPKERQQLKYPEES